MYVAEGSSVASNWTVSITNADDGVRRLAADLIRRKFHVEPFIQTGYGRCGSTRLASKRFIEWLDFVGAGRTAYEKRIPCALFDAPRSTVLAFLRGLALDAYCTKAGASPRWAICVASTCLLDDLQILLTRLGIVHSRVTKRNRQNGKTYDEVYASGAHAQEMLRLVPFLEADKAAAAAPLHELTVRGGNADPVPGISGRDLHASLPPGKSGRNGYGHRAKFRHLLDERTKQVSRRSLAKVAAVPGTQLSEWARTVLDLNLHFSPVVQPAR